LTESRESREPRRPVQPARDESTAPAIPPPRRLESSALFQLEREVVIVHHGQEYRLRVTKSDKLILTK